MRFLFLTQYYPPERGAPQTRLEAVARELVRLNHEVEIVTGMPNYPAGKIFDGYRGKFYSREHVSGVPVHRVWLYASVGSGFWRMVNYASFVLTSLLGLWRVQKPDYLFVESPPLFLALPAYLRNVFWRVPMIFNVADLWPDSVREIGLVRNRFILACADRFESWAYRKATHINAVTEGIRTVLLNEKRVPAQKILFLPNGVDAELFQPTGRNAALARELNVEDKELIVYAGTIGYAHGVEVAVRAMRILQSSHPRVHMVLIGAGSDRAQLAATIREQRLSNITLLDPNTQEFINELYSLAVAGLVTLRDLPFFKGTRPAKMFPIMAAGKPVLYSGRGEGARLLEQAGAGIVVPPEDPQALADAIAVLMASPEMALAMGKRGRQYAQEYLNWAAIVRSWLAELGSARKAVETAHA